VLQSLHFPLGKKEEGKVSFNLKDGKYQGPTQGGGDGYLPHYPYGTGEKEERAECSKKRSLSPLWKGKRWTKERRKRGGWLRQTSHPQFKLLPHRGPKREGGVQASHPEA